MTELALDDRHRDAFHHQLVGVSEAEPVGVHPLLDPGTMRQLRNGPLTLDDDIEIPFRAVAQRR